MLKPLNVVIDDQVIKSVDQSVQASKGKYRNRSHFVEYTLREKLQEIQAKSIKSPEKK